MSKSSDTWNETVLIDAFDNAMATFKAMHSGAYSGDDYAKEEKDRSNSKHNVSVPFEEMTENIESEPHGCRGLTSTEAGMPFNQVGAASDGCSAQGNYFSMDGDASEPDQHPTGYTNIDGQTDIYSDAQNKEYNDLLKQYYELEKQQQEVLQQLHQIYWNYQTPVQSSMDVLEGPGHNSLNDSKNDPQAQCSQCFCQGSAASTIAVSCAIDGLSSGSHSCCSLSKAHCSAYFPKPIPVHPGMQSACGDDKAVKMGMVAAERKIPSMNMTTSAQSNVCEDKEKAKEEENSGAFEDKGSQSISSEDDLTVVLNAWYAAGFHTGRYLMKHCKRSA